MTPIPPKLRAALALDPEYLVCCRHGYQKHVCDGPITWEHAVIYAGKQLQERWAIIPLCSKAHSVNFFQDGGDLNKEINLWIALNRATPAELQAISKAKNYEHERDRLNVIYGGIWRIPAEPLEKIMTQLIAKGHHNVYNPVQKV